MTPADLNPAELHAYQLNRLADPQWTAADQRECTLYPQRAAARARQRRADHFLAQLDRRPAPLVDELDDGLALQLGPIPLAFLAGARRGLQLTAGAFTVAAVGGMLRDQLRRGRR